MIPVNSLPLPAAIFDEELYVESLLHFVSSNSLHRSLCGGVHILDFFTRQPDLYNALLEKSWREWFELCDMQDILDLLLREDLEPLVNPVPTEGTPTSWRDKPAPPASLLSYIIQVRNLCLRRDTRRNGSPPSKMRPHIAIGMKRKKIHEVSHFAHYIDDLTRQLETRQPDCPITHIVDFGSGQNYLGRTLASEPYERRVIAVEGRPHNVEGARKKDVVAGLAPKKGLMRNKKEWRAKVASGKNQGSHDEGEDIHEEEYSAWSESPALLNKENSEVVDDIGSIHHVSKRIDDGNLSDVIDELASQTSQTIQDYAQGKMHDYGASSQDSFNDHVDANSDLVQLCRSLAPPETANLLVVSLHSCGNLSHHGLRSLFLNPAVSAVAIIGCCYNLLTERHITPSTCNGHSAETHQLPYYRQPQYPSTDQSSNLTVKLTSNHDTPSHGFPMSQRLLNHPITLNITARMMAVQAPHNWTPAESQGFFTRHFYRALLQRVFLDHGAIDPPPPTAPNKAGHSSQPGRSAAGTGSTAAGTTPIIIGSLRPAAYTSFAAYVRAAVSKLALHALKPTSYAPGHGEAAARVVAAMEGVTDEEMRRYEDRYGRGRKALAVVWSLMAFSAQVVEACVVVDRWCAMREGLGLEKGMASGGGKGACWVEPVWEYGVSPRNLVVVGVKGRETSIKQEAEVS